MKIKAKNVASPRRSPDFLLMLFRHVTPWKMSTKGRAYATYERNPKLKNLITRPNIAPDSVNVQKIIKIARKVII